VQRYSTPIELKEPRLFDIKIPVLLLIINLFVFQLIFHISTATLISVAERQNIVLFEGLTAFTFDMWFVVVLFSVGVFGYAKLKKHSHLLLATFLFMPSVIVLLSLMRNVSSLLVLMLVGAITFLIYRFNYQKLSAKLLEEAANNHKNASH